MTFVSKLYKTSTATKKEKGRTVPATFPVPSPVPIDDMLRQVDVKMREGL